jgi:predicted RecA/RadA family phage recombinase
MTNYIQEGRTVTLTAPYTVISGQGALVGSLFGIACENYTISAAGEFMIEGVFDLTKGSGVTFTQGQKVYWDNSARNVVSADSGNSYLIGVAARAALSGDATARVRLNGISVS